MKNTISELWAIVDKNGNICMSRGGSSSKSKIMVYESEKKAERGLNNNWTRQVINPNEVEIKKIYSI